MSKLEILFVSPGYLYSKDYPFERAGTESVIYGISKELASKGHEIYITGRFKNIKGENHNINGINFINIKSQKLPDQGIHEFLSIFMYSKVVAKKIKEINPEIISLNERFSAYFPSMLDFKKTFTTHNPDSMDFYKNFAINNNQFNYLLFPLKKIFENKVMSNSNAIVALNKKIKSYLEFKGYKSILIPNGVDPQYYYNNGDNGFILFAGRLDKVKGVQYLIQAFSELAGEWDNNLLIIGSGPDKERLKRLVESKNLSGRVIFIPLVKKSKFIEYLSKCSFFVLPSLFETMGVALLEAMACSKPVIASNIAGPSDIITNGYNGFLFKRKSSFELKKCMEYYLSNETNRNKFGKNARETVETNYSFKEISRKYLNLWSDLIND